VENSSYKKLVSNKYLLCFKNSEDKDPKKQVFLDEYEEKNKEIVEKEIENDDIIKKKFMLHLCQI
jgi:hypothetical protein